MFMLLTISLLLGLSPLMLGGNRWWFIYPAEILIFICYLSNYYAVNKCAFNYLPKGFEIFIKIFFILILISGLLSVNFYESMNFIILFTAIYFVFLLSLRIPENHFFTVCHVMVISGTLQPIISFFQYFDFLSHSHWNPVNFIAGTFANHNHMAGLLEITIPLSIALMFYFRETYSRKNKIIFSLALTIQISGIIWCQSRSAWAGLLISLFFLSMCLSNNKKVILFLVIILIASFITIKSVSGLKPIAKRIQSILFLHEDASATSRLKIWKATLNIIRDNPITGTGPGTFSSIFPIYREKGLNAFINHAHNDYLEWISEIGVLAMPLILLFLGYLIMHGFMTSIGDSPFGITASTALIAISIHSFTDYNLRIPAIAIYLAVLLGFSFKFKQKKLLGPGRFI